MFFRYFENGLSLNFIAKDLFRFLPLSLSLDNFFFDGAQHSHSGNRHGLSFRSGHNRPMDFIETKLMRISHARLCENFVTKQIISEKRTSQEPSL